MWPRHGPKAERVVLFLVIALILAVLTIHYPPQWDLGRFSYPSIHAPPEGPEDTSDGVPRLPHTQKLCNETQWTEGLSLWCHSACGSNGKAFCGGLTNARSRVQTCVRWAIDAGAAELVVPHVVGRMAGLRVDTYGDLTCTDAWMDMAFLNATLEANCPQLRIRLCPLDVEPEALVIEGGRGWDQLDAVGSYKGSFRTLVGSALNNQGLNFASVSPAAPVVFRYGDSYLGWNYSASEELGTIQKELFRAINYEPELVKMGSDILQNSKLRDGAYIAVHFRGEADWPSTWGSAEDQMRLYTEEMERIRGTEEGKGISDVYVSCGDKEAIERLRKYLRRRGFHVHDKSSLLGEDSEMLARVDGLDFDRRAIVDYQLLSNAKYFMGVSFPGLKSPSSARQITYIVFLHRYLQAVSACLSLMPGA